MKRIKINLEKYLKKSVKEKIKITSQQKNQFLKNIVLLLIIFIIIGLVYKLQPIYTFLSLLMTLILLPKFYREKKKEIIQKKRFVDIVSYLEQMMYSFKKKPKIREALIDAQKVGEKNMKELIEEVIVNIDAKMNDSIYEESLKLIENEYSCNRIRSLHKFIVKIEKQGGEYEKYINILLNDIREWNNRTTLFQEDVKRVKRNILISICSTLLTCAVMIYLIPKEYSYVENVIYQILTLFMLAAMIIIYLAALKKLNFDWLKEEKELSPQKVDRYYEVISEGSNTFNHMGLFVQIGDKPVKGEVKGNWFRRSTYKSAKKRIEKEIAKEFPDWLRETAINLQLETVQSAIENSYEEAAYVLKEPIRNMLLEFEKYPVGIEPYEHFMGGLDIPEVKSSIKMLYCINELGKEEADTQISSIIDRNIKMLNKAETLKNKDRIGVVSFLTAVPMFVGVLKVMTDMILMISVFTSALSNVMQSGGM